jgi:hypothetical protein
MQLANATTNQTIYYRKATSQIVFSWTEMFLKGLSVTPPPAQRNYLLPGTVSYFEMPNEAVSAPFPPTHREGTKGTSKEEAIELSSLLSSLLVDIELTISQT